MKKFLLLLAFGFVSITSFSQVPTAKIQDYLNKHKEAYKLSSSDIANWEVESTTNSKATGITNYYIHQTFQGIEVFGTNSNIWYKNGEVIEAKMNFVQSLASKVNSISPNLDVLSGLNKAHSALGESVVSHEIFKVNDNNKYLITNGSLTEDFVNAKLVFQIVNEELKLAWHYEFYSQDYKHLWSVRIDALNGDLLEKFDLTLSCRFENCSKSSHNHSQVKYFSASKLFQAQTINNALAETSVYNVLPFETESPKHGSRQLLASPYNVSASPYGWHDTNGVDGAEFTITRGNNVHAQEDANGNNGTGASPNGGLSLTFDFPYGGVGVAATTYTDAATTNLFYMSNIMHDVWYQYGFNEANGNFQQNNYGNGGAGFDYVLADSQDGSGTNNANFSTPTDGNRPRMQMYLWDVGPVPNNFIVNSPSAVSGSYYAADNQFSPGHVNLPVAPGITSDLVLYQDAVLPEFTDGCEAPTNGALMAGKIVIIRRGNCNFTAKVLNAQNAGAIAVVIVNNDTANPNQYVGMNGDGTGITIPAVFITYNMGEAIIAQMASNTVNITLVDDPVTFVNSDGDFDNGVIAHEYGHGISTRLTGGPNNSSCLGSSEQMGEGWSDWLALMMQIQAGDQPQEVRGIATFLAGQPTNGTGIREYPYTTDMNINPFTFADTNGMWYTDGNGIQRVDVHSVGSVWATMLWDLTWAYVNKYGFDPDKYNGTGGNNRVMQLVLDAMKLQPCNPSFVSGRDAIIAADQATTGGQDYCMIWEVFARRGLGVNASSGTNSGIAGINDQIEDFTEPAPGPNCVLSTNYFDNQELIKVYPNPSNGILNLRVNNYSGELTIEMFDLNGRKVLSNVEGNFSVEKALNISSLQSGVYLIKLTGKDLSYTQKVIKN